MVKNISNPLNARRVASLISEDAHSQQIDIDEREISIFLADRRFSSLDIALKQLREEDILPTQFRLSPDSINLLIEEEFMDPQSSLSMMEMDNSADDFLSSLNIESTEFKTQLDNLKSKVLQSWSGGISIDGHEMENFERKFGRPMRQFVEQQAAQGRQISDLQAFTVVYATDQLALGDSSKEDIYHLIFGRYSEIKEELETRYNIRYEWPTVLGTGFIDLGKKLCVVAELSEFGKRLRSISGIDTYPDEVIQAFFYELISGRLTEELVRKKLFYRWADKSTTIADFHQWFVPPSTFSSDARKQQMFLYAIMTHTLLLKIDPDNASLLAILKEIHHLSSASQLAYLAQKLEASLTRKAVSLQFATTLSNFFENFKTNPSRVTPFLQTTVRYYQKSETLETVINSIYFSIRTGLKNSTGIIKKYLRNISEDELSQTIFRLIKSSAEQAIEEALGGDFRFDIYDVLDKRLETASDAIIDTFFTALLDNIYTSTRAFARDLEPQREEPVDTSGGLRELTHDFPSTISFYGPKNTTAVEILEALVSRDFDRQTAEWIAYITSYMTYQVASKEGAAGDELHRSLSSYYEHKYRELGQFPLHNGSVLKSLVNLYTDFVYRDLQQAQALVHLASKVRVDIYNAWTPLTTSTSKAANYLNDFVLPNLLYWQRLPQDLITTLVDTGQIQTDDIRSLVLNTRRLSMIEAYALIIIGMRTEISSMQQAKEKLASLFTIDDDAIEMEFQLDPRQGEAEIAREIVYLWHALQEEN